MTMMTHPSQDTDLPVAILIKDRGKNKLVLPEAAAQIVLALARKMTSHGGVDKTRDVVKDKLWMPGLAQDIMDMVDNCLPCKQRKKHNLHDGEYMPVISSRSPGEMVYIKLITISVSRKDGDKYIMGSPDMCSYIP